MRLAHVMAGVIWSCAMSASLYVVLRHDAAGTRSGAVVARLAEKQGTVQYRPQDIVVWDYAALGQELYVAEVIATGRESVAKLDLGGDRAIDMAENTQLTLATAADKDQYIVTLLKGHIEASVGGGAEKRGAKPVAPVLVQIGSRQVALANAGLRFELSRSVKDDSVIMKVKSGEAQTMTTDGKTVETVTAAAPTRTWIEKVPAPRYRFDPKQAVLAQAETREITPTLRLASRAAPQPEPALAPKALGAELPATLVATPAPVATKAAPKKELENAPQKPVITPKQAPTPPPPPVAEPAPIANRAAAPGEVEEPVEPAMAAPVQPPEPIAVATKPNPLLDVDAIFGMRYGAPISAQPLVSKVSYIGAMAELQSRSFLGSVSLGVDVFTRGEDRLEGMHASFEAKRAFVGRPFRTEPSLLGSRFELTPKLIAGQAKAEVPYYAKDSLIAGQIDTGTTPAFGLDVAAEANLSWVTLRLGGGYGLNLVANDIGRGHHYKFSGDLLVNVFELEGGTVVSLLAFGLAEKDLYIGKIRGRLGFLETLAFDHNYAGAGIQIAW